MEARLAQSVVYCEGLCGEIASGVTDHLDVLNVGLSETDTKSGGDNEVFHGVADPDERNGAVEIRSLPPFR